MTSTHYPGSKPTTCRACGRDVLAFAAKHAWLDSSHSTGPACSDQCLTALARLQPRVVIAVAIYGPADPWRRDLLRFAAAIREHNPEPADVSIVALTDAASTRDWVASSRLVEGVVLRYPAHPTWHIQQRAGHLKAWASPALWRRDGTPQARQAIIACDLDVICRSRIPDIPANGWHTAMAEDCGHRVWGISISAIGLGTRNRIGEELNSGVILYQRPDDNFALHHAQAIAYDQHMAHLSTMPTMREIPFLDEIAMTAAWRQGILEGPTPHLTHAPDYQLGATWNRPWRLTYDDTGYHSMFVHYHGPAGKQAMLKDFP